MQKADLNEKKIELFNLGLVKITDINVTFALNFPSLYLRSWSILLYRVKKQTVGTKVLGFVLVLIFFLCFRFQGFFYILCLYKQAA